MSCMKCGRDVEAGQIFCENCLEEMEKYPVKPETVVLIPTRTAGHGVKKQHQRRQTPEEQIAALEKRCKRLMITLLISWLLLAGVSVIAGISIYELDVHQWLGQNYHTAGETDPPAPNLDWGG